MGDADLVAYVQRFVGYTLTGMTGEEVVAILWGTGANGKSTFRETVFALLGDYAVASDASLLVANKKGREATPELARLFGARLVTRGIAGLKLRPKSEQVMGVAPRSGYSD
jgi:putative DNA primase/helicase